MLRVFQFTPLYYISLYLKFFYLLLLVSSPLHAQTNGQLWTLELKTQDGTYTGHPLLATEDHIDLLLTNGQWAQIPTKAVDHYRKESDRFISETQSRMKGELLIEFGSRYTVTGTGHYLVVHLKNSQKGWPKRFEELYRSFEQYFRVRGLALEKPPFPLVAVIFPTQQEFLKDARLRGKQLPSQVLGYYDVATNRIYLFDNQKVKKNSQEATGNNLATIIHEATHQMAFNTGVHSRFSATPRWVVEGLGTLYEAPGMWDRKLANDPKSRVNQKMLGAFRAFQQKGRPQGYFLQLIQRDRLFQTNSEAAYAESWALSFFLSETMPKEYAQYLKRTAEREIFTQYSPIDRLNDFKEFFGKSPAILENRFLQFIEKQKDHTARQK
ncbi:MAG: DUF1570 domain-containing protein [Pirellulaceae bacterium]|nr:DUF1570 domain-containing protein [Pirellulaceae bacterium]